MFDSAVPEKERKQQFSRAITTSRSQVLLNLTRIKFLVRKKGETLDSSRID
jgi:hypothetical protein